MKRAFLTRHARERVQERSSLSLREVRRLLDDTATIQIGVARGGRQSHRLFYSIPDEAWFVAMQDADDGGVLTTLPLDYYINLHGPVTALARRQARKLARQWQAQRAREASPLTNPPVEHATASPNATPVEPPAPAATWKVHVTVSSNGSVASHSLGRTEPAFGEPDSWDDQHPVHAWFRERFIALGVSYKYLLHVRLERGKLHRDGGMLVENMIMTAEELEACR